MTEQRAKVLALRWRASIGYLLQELKKVKHNPDNYPPGYVDDRRQFLQANIKALKEIYILHPSIKPIRIRQLDLFSKKRQVEEQELISNPFVSISYLLVNQIQQRIEESFGEPDPTEQFLNSVKEFDHELS